VPLNYPPLRQSQRHKSALVARMPSIEENLAKWDEDDWSTGGDSWSRPWGDVAAQWYGCLLPRIHRFLPARSVLEIAPGFGRWTSFLLDHCDTLIGVDVTPKCTAACQRRFADHVGATFATNDGRSLPMVGDGSIDFAFSFDALVHVEADALASYAGELARVLTEDGVAFLHHSNYGAYQRSARALASLQSGMDLLPVATRVALLRIGVYRGRHWRAASVTAERFAELCHEAGLNCVAQELVNWEGGVLLLDCMSVVTRPGSRWDHPRRVLRNHLFRSEAWAVRHTAQLYGAVRTPRARGEL